MKVKDIIKKQTTLIALAVAFVVVTTIGVSYAIFFNVGKNTQNQVITAGTLQLTISNPTALSINTPLDNASGLNSSPLTYTVANSGNLPASYKIYVYADTDHTLDLSKIKISTDGSTSKAISSITDTITEDDYTYYQIDSGNIAANASALTKNVRAWADEDSMTDSDNGKKVNLKIYIVSEVQE